MRRDIFTSGDSVLLLGEGNFSFSVGLLKLHLGIKIFATCFESVLTKIQLQNCEILKSHGACVLSGVDATQVHVHPILSIMKFDKIVFNFPHAGGKMKIHLNRELLRTFFLSASNLLRVPGGNIVVSLCSGQGADFLGKRVWADSWQVVDMAGHANLLLVECSAFDWSLFPSYINVGYRNMEKGFHSEDAVVHRFALTDTLNLHVERVIDFYSKESNNNSDDSSLPFFVRRLGQDILCNDSTPTAFILKNLQKQVNFSHKCNQHTENKLYLGNLEESCHISALQLWAESDCNILLHSFFVLNWSLKNFKQSPLVTQTLLIGENGCDIFITALSKMMYEFEMRDFQVRVKNSSSSSTKSRKKILLQLTGETNGVPVAELYLFGKTEAVLIQIDNIVLQIFSLTCWRQVWAKNIYVTLHNGKPSVTGICPYPVSYTFDVSFIIKKGFKEDFFFKLLWDIGGEIIVNVIKVSEFCPSNQSEKSLCFRLSYMSFEHPMCREKVLSFHHNVLGKVLEKVLGVCVK